MRPRKLDIVQTGPRLYEIKTIFYPEELRSEEEINNLVNEIAQLSLDTLKKQELIPNDAELMVIFATQNRAVSETVTITVMWHSASVDGELPVEDGNTSIEDKFKRFNDALDKIPNKSAPNLEYTVYIVCDNLDAVLFVAKQMSAISNMFTADHIPMVYKDPTYMDYAINIAFPLKKEDSSRVEATLLHICDYDGIDVYDAEDFSKEYFNEHGELICDNLFKLADI